MVAQMYNSSTWEVDVGKFKAMFGYKKLRPYCTTENG